MSESAAWRWAARLVLGTLALGGILLGLAGRPQGNYGGLAGATGLVGLGVYELTRPVDDAEPPPAARRSHESDRA